MTALEVVQDTVEFYRTNPKAQLKGGACQYKTEDGKMCALGRFIDWEKVEKRGLSAEFLNNNIGSYDASYTNRSTLISLLRSDVVGLDESLWGDLQEFHDSCVGTNSQETRALQLLDRWKN